MSLQMKALVGFSDPDLKTHLDPRGGVAPNAEFTAPTAEAANRFEAAGLAERIKTPSPPSKA